MITSNASFIMNNGPGINFCIYLPTGIKQLGIFDIAGCVYASILDSGPNIVDVVSKSARRVVIGRDWLNV